MLEKRGDLEEVSGKCGAAKPKDKQRINDLAG